MITIPFLAEWALRSSVLILSGALLLWALRVKDPSIRLAAWTMVLLGSIAIPALQMVLPQVPFPAMHVAAIPPGDSAPPSQSSRTTVSPVFRPADSPSKQRQDGSKTFDWTRAAVSLYVSVALVLLFRLVFGMVMSVRLLRSSRLTGQATEGIEIRESAGVGAPATLGIVRPAIVVPPDWREWNAAKLAAVLAHERSHVRRLDPLVQLLSAIHRALLWYSPLSWFLHARIVRTAEDASDDAALVVTRDRAFYAELLLDFMQRGLQRVDWIGVPMARYGRPDKRIHRILDGTALSRGVTRLSAAAILAIGSPLACVVAAMHPHSQVVSTSGQIIAQSNMQPPAAVEAEPEPVYLRALGSVTPFHTVTVKPRIDGQLIAVSFKEGELVQAGQLLASVDSDPYKIQLAQAEGEFSQDQAKLTGANRDLKSIRTRVRAGIELQRQLDDQAALAETLAAKVRTDQANVDHAKLQLSYTQLRSPISGLAGLRLVDSGNMVHASDATGIVVITQLQPISVLFGVPEDNLPQLRTRLRSGASPLVEAWNRTNTIRIATGHLTAADNQIDATTGTAKLKAVFDNTDGALFPNQFVNVRLFANTR